MTQSELENKIDKFSDLIDDFGESNFNSRELWQLQKEIFQNFKETDFHEQEDRQNNWNKFQSLVDTLKKKQDEINIENEKFADEADRLIENLKNSMGDGLFSKQLEKSDFAELRTLSTEILEFIKQPRFPSKERRVNVWDKFNNLRDKLRKQEDEYYSKLREKINRRIENSQELTEKILDTIDACHPETPIEKLLKCTGILLSFLTPLGYIAAGFGFLFKAFEIGMGIEEQKPKSPLRLKSDALREVRKFISDNKDDITREDKQKIYGSLNEVQEALDNAWTDYKEELQRKQEEREQKKANWERNQRDFLEKLEARLEQQIAFKDKMEKRLENQNEFLEKQEKRLENQQDFLRKLNDQLEDLEEKYSSAWNDDFKDKVSDWIDDKKSKISEVEDDIDKIEDKIRDVKRNIEEIEEKIEEVEKSITELEKKIDEVRGKL